MAGNLAGLNMAAAFIFLEQAIGLLSKITPLSPGQGRLKLLRKALDSGVDEDGKGKFTQGFKIPSLLGLLFSSVRQKNSQRSDRACFCGCLLWLLIVLKVK